MLSLSVSPSLMRRADETARARFAEEQEKLRAKKLVEERERNLIKEIGTGGGGDVMLGTLPPKSVRNNRSSLKKLASSFAVRDRPKSATGMSNGKRAAVRLQRALEFEKKYEGGVGARPSTASGH